MTDFFAASALCVSIATAGSVRADVSPATAPRECITVAYEQIELPVLGDNDRGLVVFLPLGWQSGDPALLLIGEGSTERQRRAALIAVAWGVALLEWSPHGAGSLDDRPDFILAQFRDGLGAGPTAAVLLDGGDPTPRLVAWINAEDRLPPSAEAWLTGTVDAVLATARR